MAWGDDREQAREAAAQPLVRLDQNRLLASMGRGPSEKRASIERRPQNGQALRIRRRLRPVELEIARHHDARRPELVVALGMGSRLREAEIEAAQQRTDRAR